MPDAYSDGPHGTTCRPGCGQCCQVLQLPLTRADVEQDPSIPERVRRWYLTDLIPIGWREAKRRAPWLQRPSTIMPVHDGQQLARYPSYYRCGLYDEATQRCTAWADRPEPCAGFPYYGRPSLEGMRLPTGCEFRRDQGETPVILTRKEGR